MAQTVIGVSSADIRYKPDILVARKVGKKKNGRQPVSMSIGVENDGTQREMIVHESLAAENNNRPLDVDIMEM